MEPRRILESDDLYFEGPGWYIVDNDGNVVRGTGPSDSPEEAQERYRKRPPPPMP